jgi:nucleoside-diphosphate-sugar epimerase
MRLAPSVHGPGDGGFVPRLIGIAREKGVAAYVGDGANRWPGAHRLDAARLYRLALESAPAGTVAHAIADEGIAFRVIAEIIGRHAGVPAASIPASDADAHFGFPGMFAQLDNPTSSQATREFAGLAARAPGPRRGPGGGALFSLTVMV